MREALEELYELFDPEPWKHHCALECPHVYKIAVGGARVPRPEIRIRSEMWSVLAGCCFQQGTSSTRKQPQEVAAFPLHSPYHSFAIGEATEMFEMAY